MLLIGWAIIQLKPVQNYLAGKIEQSFNETFEGTLSIERFGGVLPFNIRASNIVLYYEAYNSDPDTIFTAEQLSLRIDFRSLLSGDFRIDGARLHRPDFYITTDAFGNTNLANALRQNTPTLDVLDQEYEATLPNLPEFFLSGFVISDGSLSFQHQYISEHISLPDLFIAEEINLNVSAQIAKEFRFLNLNKLTFKTPQLEASEWEFRGQFFSDNRFLEFNALRIQTPQSNIFLNLVFDGVDLQKAELQKQILESKFNIQADFQDITSSEFADIIPVLEPFEDSLFMELRAEGTFSEVSVNNLNMIAGDTRVKLMAELFDFLDSETLAANIMLDVLTIEQRHLDILGITDKNSPFRDAGVLRLDGNISGSFSEVNADLNIVAPEGSITLKAEVSFSETPVYKAEALVKNLHFKHFPSLNQPQSRLNASFKIDGIGTDLKSASTNFRATFTNSRLFDVKADRAEFVVQLSDGFIEPTYFLRNEQGTIAGSGWIDLMQDELITQLSGEIENLDLSKLIRAEDVHESDLNFRYTLRLNGSEMDTFYGDLFIEFRESMYRELPINEQEFILSLNSPTAPERVLMIDGNILQAKVTGSLFPSLITETVNYWDKQIKHIIRDRTIFTDFGLAATQTGALSQDDKSQLFLSLDATVKDLSLILTFLPDFPLIETLTKIELVLSSSKEAVQVMGKVNAEFLNKGDISVENLLIDIEADLFTNRRYDFFNGALITSFDKLQTGVILVEHADIMLSAYDEAFVLEKFEAIAGNDVQVGLTLSSVFSEFDVDIRIMEFFVGDQDYSWVNISQNPIVIDRLGRIRVDQLEFANQDERVFIDGVFSETQSDSVIYRFSNFQLRTLSDLTDIGVTFAGVMNGEFQTRMLRTDPEFQGSIRINRVEVDEYVVGDIDFNSTLNREAERLDVSIRILTDPNEYGEYLSRVSNVGKDVRITGFARNPNTIQDGETIAELDFDFRELDLWVLPYFVTGIFTDVSGRTTGSGKFLLYKDTFDYDARFRLTNVELVPVFLNTRLTLNGDIDLNKRDGVVIKNVNVRDNRGGTGVLYGSIGVGDFESEMPMNVFLSMNRLQFLNNTYEPEIAFFGRVQGTGLVNLSGTDRSPFISTPEPVIITANSTISIPIETDSYVDERSRFIEFVESFDVAFRPRSTGDTQTDTERPELTFMEQFSLDLQFIASEDMNVRLVFDQVTSEILNARGNGRIRLTLQDEEFRVFGRFDVSGGDYNFVGGDIFSRRFAIRDGGSISWDGDPVNARINVTASYRARPDISILRPEIGQGDPVRVPVELILVITGNLESIENDFFFEFPSGVDASQTTAFLALLNSEDQKLLQATSLLFTGNFIPVGTDTRDAGATLQGRAGQIGLGTLLSSQINNLLNSNLSNLDIDLNLTGFDQADLGVALRLFDDRLTLRREGVVTGPDANLGDFDITYRINRYFSVQAFHRRDPLLRDFLTSAQSQFESVNGVGLEGRVQFNSWPELRRRIWTPIRRTFTFERDEKKEALTQSI